MLLNKRQKWSLAQSWWIIPTVCLVCGSTTEAQDDDSKMVSIAQRIERCEKALQKLSERDPEMPVWNRYLESIERDGSLWKRFEEYYKTEMESKDEFIVLSREDLVAARLSKIDSLKHELKELNQPKFAEFLKQGQMLCEERHRLLFTQPVPPTPELRNLVFDTLSFPKIDGSTSTQPLAALIACRYFDLDFRWTKDLKWTKEPSSSFMDLDIELKLAEYSLTPLERIETQRRLAGIVGKFLVGNESTHRAYRNILEGKSGFGLLARKPNADEIELARKQNVEFDVVPCARDAFIFLVNQDGPVTELTTDQIKEIYSGTAKNWNHVGGNRNTKIYPYRRPKNSGSEELMSQLVMRGTPLPENVASELVGRLMSTVFLDLSQNNDGIAYSVRYYEHFMAGSARTRTIKIDGVAPNRETIEDGTYPYIADVYAVIRKDSQSESGPRKLLQWLLSTEGQAVVKQSGYVPIPRM